MPGSSDSLRNSQEHSSQPGRDKRCSYFSALSTFFFCGEGTSDKVVTIPEIFGKAWVCLLGQWCKMPLRGEALKQNAQRCDHGELKVQKHHQVTRDGKIICTLSLCLTYLKKNRARSWMLNFVKTRSTCNAGPVLRWEAAVKGRILQTQPHQALTTTATHKPWLWSPCSQTFLFYPPLIVSIPGEGGHDTHICWHMHLHELTQNFRDLIYRSNIMWKIYFQSLQM